MSQNKTIDYFLKAAWQSVANKYNNIATQYGFTQAAGYILINIHREGTPVSQIANSTGVKTTSLSRVLTNLESLGFIYRESSAVDKRSVKVFLTPLGMEKRKIAKDVVKGFNEFLETQFSEKERKLLGDMLLKINNLANAYEPQVDIEEKR
ncbi:DNA-binding MarR family transcriptional regulator [Sphingobacterium alimentarium]|jgi:DNA-binding MarR family transcriptional regulator|uniref:DNA-binding MarR family transcriptional regulator n=1 Tax=Sphingobacterium alimentarium TaxID=797292 RepID=A0A4R3VXE6_9SPHI|nr:MarR family transcriptional regulator [Sphingobacterium alimentarium]TCV20823.1 DNA-binding MarR family transcriptional regulator [Sphingobacterium alimentarium]